MICPQCDQIDTRYCIYCDTPVEHISALPLDDDEGWEALAKEHQPDCEWILTRAHQQDEEDYHEPPYPGSV